jgi:hypothetical protein
MKSKKVAKAGFSHIWGKRPFWGNQCYHGKPRCKICLYIQAITLLHNFIINTDRLPAGNGQPANITAHGEFDAEELESHC